MPAAVGRIQIWDEDGQSSGAAHLIVNLVSGFQCICDEWMKDLRAGQRVTLDGVDWQLRLFEQFPSPHPRSQWPFWCIKLELEK